MAIKTPPQTLVDISQDVALSNESKTLISGRRKPRTNTNVDNYLLKEYGRPKFHWVKDKPDARDYRYQLQPVTALNSVDLRRYCTPIEDQENLGSCTGQAIAGAIELINKKNGIVYDSSRLFIYYYERFLINTVYYDSGAYIRDGIKVVSKYGSPLESLWPYIISRFTMKPNSRATTDALQRRVTLYERATDFDACINALTVGYPVVVGFYVYSSFISSFVSRTGLMPYPNVSRESLLGGHAVLLVGFDHTSQRFIARNSWGTKWGDQGYFYMPYQVIKNRNMSDDFWVIKSITNPPGRK